MKELLFLVLFVAALALPVSAIEVDGGDVDGTAVVSDPTVNDVPVDSGSETDSTENPVEAASDLADPVALAADFDLAGGYYFVCDCVLGYDMKFYVPLEWAHDVFTLDNSGAPVNLSTSTCYAYCPDYPDYTFSANRFGTFFYRASNYNSSDLQITKISDTNISFLEDEAKRLSDSELLFAIACLIMVFGGVALFRRWR